MKRYSECSSTLIRALNYESAVPFRSSFDLKLVGKILGSTVGGSLTERGEYRDMVIVIFVRMPCELSPKAVSVLCSFL